MKLSLYVKVKGKLKNYGTNNIKSKKIYISLTVKLALLFILFVVQFIAPLLQDSVLLFYHGGPCKHIYCCSIMYNPVPNLGLFRLIFCMRGKLFFLVDILSTFVAAPCSRTIRNITCLSNSVQHGIKSRRYPVFVESSRVVFLSNQTPVVSLLISSQ